MINKKIALAFVFFLVYLGLLQFTTDNIIGFDGFSHTKSADIIKEEGFIKEFRWLPFTTLFYDYANIQILFHILLIPFIYGVGPKLASILFSSLFFTIFYWFLKKNKVKHSFIFAVLLLTGSTELTYRFLLTRPFVLGLAAFILVLFFIQKKKYKLLGLIFIFYSLVYSGFVFGLVAVIIYFIVNSKKPDYKLLIYAIGGVAIGLMVNPYFPANLSFLYLQWFEVNLAGNLFNQEWRAWPLSDLVKFSWIFILTFFIGLILTFRNKKFNKDKVYLAVLTGIFFLALLTSRRFLEYFAPLSIILFALNFDQIKFIKLKNLTYIIFVFLIVLGSFNFFVTRTDIKNNDFLHRFDSCIEWMNENIPKNSLVFNNVYTFNYLFYNNAKLRYTHGLDLTYSFLHNENKFNRYMNILRGGSTNFNIVKEDYNADYVFIGKIEQDIQLFNYINDNNENFELEYNDLDCTILKVK